MTIFSINAFGQKPNCGCDKIKLNPENQYKCDTTIFTNRSMLYWQWNCDSSWLTFENKEKVILSSCEEPNVYECQRTGLHFLKEYPNYLLFEYKWTSGCCTPPDIVFISKENGKEIKRINNDQFIAGNVDDSYVIYFADTIYEKLIYLDNNSDNEYSIQFDFGEVVSSINKNQVLELPQLFSNFKKKNDYFTFDFKTSERKIENFKIMIE